VGWDVREACEGRAERALRAYARLQGRLADQREARTRRRVDRRAGRIPRRVPAADAVAEDRIDGPRERRIAAVRGDRLRCRIAQAEGSPGEILQPRGEDRTARWGSH